jgi:hypothetical protein
MQVRQIVGLALLSGFLVACGDDSGGSTIDAPSSGSDDAAIDARPDSGPPMTMLDVSGPITGTGTADGATFVAWVVTSGSPDYIYKFGQGTQTGTMFMVTLDTVPPAAAINSVGIAVGLVVVATSTTQPPDGMIDESAITGAAYSVNHAIIYKAPNASSIDWIDDFPEGYSCGVCVPATTGFDSFAPTSCTTVEVVQGAEDGCNWT